MDHKRRVAAEGPLARKRLKDQSHAALSPSSITFQLEGPPIAGFGTKSARNALNSKDPQDLDQMVEDSVYRQMLPVVKRELEHKRDVDMALVRRGVKRVNAPEKEDVVCAVCRTPKTFKGFDALLIHAERFMKENARQHRGYFRALKEALQDEDDLESGKKCHRDFRPKDVVEAAPACCSASSPGQAAILAGETGKLASWKPNILLVQDEKLNEVERIICPWPSHRESSDGRHACTILDRTQKPRLKEILAVYSSGKDDKRNVFVFPAAEVGYIDGKELTLACQKEHKVLEYNCDDHRNLDLRSTNKTTMVSASSMAANGWRSMKERHGLKLLPESEVYGRRGELFDNGKFDRINKIMTRWANNFKTLNRNFEVQRSFRDGRRMYELDRVWQDDLKRIESYAPATKKKVRTQMSAIESELKKEQLVWLQEVEDVREQFQRMADSMKKEEEATTLRNLRWSERNLKKQQKMEHEQIRLDNLRRIGRVKSELLSKRYKRNVEGQLMVETWIDEYQRLYRESCKAKNERLRLQTIHDKVHTKAYITKKRECPICFELFRKADLMTMNRNVDGPFKQFLPVNKLCLDLGCPQRHKFKS
ncbi:hypothetical protein M758_10G162200 [Ceratodon purpureus]|uniref:Uncharacterized protein n=1 Tax=Ceratodon purpureus TaxID=3225 RepID=A0A8T0GRF2_CERPU|nr:hypothetical protein KC19_10G167000 [Ceratodon purpureus]KAG0604319.1 hypothetical protein M758_10G162200 [Ceratodon purpureus]